MYLLNWNSFLFSRRIVYEKQLVGSYFCRSLYTGVYSIFDKTTNIKNTKKKANIVVKRSKISSVAYSTIV